MFGGLESGVLRERSPSSGKGGIHEDREVEIMDEAGSENLEVVVDPAL